MTFARQNLVLRVLVMSFSSSLPRRCKTRMAARMPKIPEINPCRNTPRSVVVPKIGEKILRPMYATSPKKNAAPKLWKKVLPRQLAGPKKPGSLFFRIRFFLL